ncbi:MAG: hypothetical protein HIU92_16305 [Proteobacteria bacterium]|nr:hypothetical protein [Pseudomonadota bacterium]
MSISANTETFSSTVTAADAAVIPLLNGRLLIAGQPGDCVDDLVVSPPLGSTVEYTRFGYDRAIISIVTAGSPIKVSGYPTLAASSNGGGRFYRRYNQRLQIAIDHNDATCPASSTIRLPVSGALLRLGDEIYDDADPRDPLRTLLSGSLSIYGRATDYGGNDWVSIASAWIIRQFSRIGVMRVDELFLADAVPLPPGSVLTDAQTINDLPADWSGFADIDFTPIGPRGFQISASGYASEIDVGLPAAIPADERGRHEQPLRISLGLIARWVADPNLHVLALLLLACGFSYRVRRWVQEEVVVRRERR